jgi:hypothetical protein
MFKFHTVRRFVASMLLVTVPIIGYTAAPASAYDRATVYNRTNLSVSGTVYYAACRSDNFSVAGGAVTATGITQTQVTMGTSRGACLITRISATVGGKAAENYTSSGTSYSQFLVVSSGSGYRVVSTQQLAREAADATGSPGFRVVNNTNYPVEVSLGQVSCLYYGVVAPGQAFDRTTGAVWFTLSAQQQMDMVERTTLSKCVLPVAAIVGSILIGALTAGVGAYIGLGAAAAAPAVGSAAAALAPIVTSTAVTVSGAAIGGALAAGGTGTLVSTALGNALKANGQGELKGQYAGPPWPFRCTVKPTYTITGGWGKTTRDTAGNVVIPLGTPISIAKTNTCGNGMM